MSWLNDLTRLCGRSHQYVKRLASTYLTQGLLDIQYICMEEDLRQIIKDQGEETRRHFDVVAEDLKSEIQTVAEQVVQNSENITIVKEKLEQHSQKFERIEAVLGTVKIDLEFIKHELRRKVDYDEFAALEKRVSTVDN